LITFTGEARVNESESAVGSGQRFGGKSWCACSKLGSVMLLWSWERAVFFSKHPKSSALGRRIGKIWNIIEPTKPGETHK
jgi:hypothetical protein